MASGTNGIACMADISGAYGVGYGSDPSYCPTYSEWMSVANKKLVISGNYQDDQLVKFSDFSRYTAPIFNIWFTGTASASQLSGSITLKDGSSQYSPSDKKNWSGSSGNPTQITFTYAGGEITETTYLKLTIAINVSVPSGTYKFYGRNGSNRFTSSPFYTFTPSGGTSNTINIPASSLNQITPYSAYYSGGCGIEINK